MARRNNSFRPYRIQRNYPKPILEEIVPFKDCQYLVGDIVYCKDGTNRSITKIEPRSGFWIIHWLLINEKGQGVTLESALLDIDIVDILPALKDGDSY